ncbi:NUDIX domain-containing protein [Exiguobacterium oxidotolerans]|uniref:NUDIX domain-containing protein n=1 Tax=Exiguobacterium oxidotolerans TaxID=223958 RepID=UPI000493D45F|nr:NUDIX domain-containing protein [Exiguobacterium oxidotolerans]
MRQSKMNTKKEIPTFGLKQEGMHYQNKPSVYAVVFDKRQQKYLTVRTNSQHFFLPGGGMEVGESPEQALHRELLEETGYTIRIEAPLGRSKQHLIAPNGEALLNDAFFYEVTLLELTQAAVEVDHHMTWLSIQDTDKLFHAHQAWAVRKVVKR